MFQQLVLFTYSGTLEISLSKDCKVQIQLSEQEQDTIKSMCETFYAERQRDLSKLVGQPLAQIADFTEVPDALA